MPYNYTPNPVYTVPVQLASDGDPASSATIMGPIEAASDNIAALAELGPKNLRTVADLAALRSLTGMAHGEIALIGSTVSGTPGESLGLWRFREGWTPFGVANSLTYQKANDNSGSWAWVDTERANVAEGLAALDSDRNLNVRGGTYPRAVTGVNVEGTSGAAKAVVTVGQYGQISIGSGGLQYVGTGGTVLLDNDGTEPLGSVLNVATGAGTGDPLDPPDDGLHIRLRGGLWTWPDSMTVFQGDAYALNDFQIGGNPSLPATAKVVSGSTLRIESTGKIDLESGSTTTLKGGAAFALQDRIRHEVIRYANGLFTGSPIAVSPGTADEHILGGTPTTATTIALSDPTASGQRVRFSRDVITPTTTVLTVTASGTSYSLSGTNGHLRFLELVAAPDSSLTLTWYPSTYAIH